MCVCILCVCSGSVDWLVYEEVTAQRSKRMSETFTTRGFISIAYDDDDGTQHTHVVY